MSMEAAGEKDMHEHVRKIALAPFVLKTYTLVEDSETDDVISWNEDGTGFVVWKPIEFTQNILPKHFKHSNFSSFVRQLNTYGFRKVAASRWEFGNDKFKRDQKELLFDIHRRKAWTSRQQRGNNARIRADQVAPQEMDEDQRSSSSSSSLDYSILMEENKRLKMEYELLSNEVEGMKRKCKELVELAAKDGVLLENIDQEENKKAPMLFGVRLEVQGDIERKKLIAEIRESASILFSQSCK